MSANFANGLPDLLLQSGPPDQYIRFVNVPMLPELQFVRIGTLRGWLYKSVRGHRPQTALVGGVRYTTRRWLADFFRATSAGPTAADADASRSRSTARRTREREQAKRELEQAGI
jgi:hypothetical protein